jgi:alkanesulfonate monooxygenase SsuD/methylene tetrahydromethanopterin reductase-like flavin-dependent oxidoreductase (luciferase family)
MRLSYLIDPHLPWPVVRSLATHAANVGYQGFWIADHLLPEPVRGSAAPLEAFSTLGALAAELRGAQLGTLVSPLTFRPAPVLAAFATTLSELTGGRFVLGVGLGGDPDEHRLTGLKWPDYEQRLCAVEQGCQTIRRLLDVHPRPVLDAASSRVPLLIGGTSGRTLKLVGALADQWIRYCDPEQIKASLDIIGAAAVAAGRERDAVAPGAILMLLDDDVPIEWRANLPSPALGLVEAEDIRLLREFHDAGTVEVVICDHRIAPERRPHALDRLIRLCESVSMTRAAEFHG